MNDSTTAPESLSRVDAVTHDGIVVAFGEQRGNPSRLWYRVLDLQQTADDDQEGTWEDATRWTRWYEVPWPTELRAVGSGLLTIDKTVDHRYSAQAGRWKAVSDGSHIYLFRALELSPGATRVSGSSNVHSARPRSTRSSVVAPAERPDHACSPRCWRDSVRPQPRW